MPKVRVFLEVEIETQAPAPDELTELTDLLTVGLTETALTAGGLRKFSPRIVHKGVIHAEHVDPPKPRRKSPKGIG